MKVLRAAERVATPWKNGGGVTREIAAWPTGAGFDDFHWRLSMAEVRDAGPFSSFAGVDRMLAVLDGRLALSVGDGDQVELTPDSSAFAFAGDARTFGRPIGGPVVDLNVMARRGIVSARLDRIEVRQPLELPASLAVRLIVASGRLRVNDVELERHDVAWIPPSDMPARLATRRPALAWLVDLAAAPRRG